MLSHSAVVCDVSKYIPPALPYSLPVYFIVSVFWFACKNTNKPTRPTLPPNDSFPTLRAILVRVRYRAKFAAFKVRDVIHYPYMPHILWNHYDTGRACKQVAEFLSHGQGKLDAATTQSQSRPISRHTAPISWGEGGRSLTLISNSKCADVAAMRCR